MGQTVARLLLKAPMLGLLRWPKGHLASDTILLNTYKTDTLKLVTNF